jgi:small subunit ribosomal protein S3
VQLRRQLKDRLRSAGISAIDIERAANKLVIRLFTARPGIIIGRKGAEIDKLKADIQKRTSREVFIDILEVNKPWKSRWFVERGYDKLLVEDVKLKAELREKLKAAGVSSVEVERPGNKLRLIIRTARPGIIIGRKGAEIDKLKADIQKRTSREVFIDILEVNKPELDAQLVAENIALQLEKRVSFRRAMRKSVDSALRFGCKGIKVRVSGRLNGNEIARSEWYLQGRLPLHTLRADIDYGFAEAHTTYGIIGVKTWVYRGDIYEQKKRRDQGITTGAFAS